MVALKVSYTVGKVVEASSNLQKSATPLSRRFFRIRFVPDVLGGGRHGWETLKGLLSCRMRPTDALTNGTSDTEHQKTKGYSK